MTAKTGVKFTHRRHPHTKAVLAGKAKPATHKQAAGTGLNAKVALTITGAVGTMLCAYIFTGIALLSLPTILKQAGYPIGFDLGDGTVLIVSWIAQTFIQLVLLSVIIVGQNIQAKASDKRAEETYQHALATLHEAQQIQAHLATQDEALTALVAKRSSR